MKKFRHILISFIGLSLFFLVNQNYSIAAIISKDHNDCITIISQYNERKVWEDKTMNEPEQKKAQSCELEIYFQLTNINNEKQKLRDGTIEAWQAFSPMYEMLIPQHENFSLRFCFDNWSNSLAYEVPVNDMEELLTEFKDSMNLKEGEQRFIRTTLDSLIFVIKRRNDEAIVYNLYHKKNSNADYDLSYHVPWVEYEKMINNTLQKYGSLIQNVENLAFKFFNETSQSVPVDGIVLTAHTDNKAPVIGSSMNITLKITNVSSEAKELVNDFEISSGSANPFEISVNGNPLAGLKKKPVTLKPGESYTLQTKVKMDRYESTIKIEYYADNDFSNFTNMVPASYLDMLGKRGIHHYDLTKCWQGELETEISLFVLAQNWKEVIKTEMSFEEWLKSKIARKDKRI